MSAVFRELERLERRVLGALRCVDLASGAAIEAPLRVTGPGARLLRNRSGLYVITEWTALAEHASTFADPPAEPALFSQTLSLSVHDPAGRYLPRLVAVDLPRDPAPANLANADSLFQPIEVPLFPSPAAPVLANWATVRVSVGERARGDALGGALILVRAGSDVIARGLTDWRGEALVPVVGIPVTTWSSDPDAVIITEIAASVEVYFDASVGMLTPQARVRDGHPPGEMPVVDPAAIEEARSTLPNATHALNMAAGRQYSLSMEIVLP